MKKIHHAIVLLVTSLIFASTSLTLYSSEYGYSIGLMVTESYGCSFEGCLSKGGFPFNVFSPDGIGGSSASGLLVLLNFLTIYFLIYLLYRTIYTIYIKKSMALVKN